MNRADPTSADTNFLGAADHELSLEEVAEIQALDATTATELTETPLTTPLETTSSLLKPSPARVPSIPPLRRRLVSGRYRSGGAGYQVELRVDVDGKRPTMRISGDFFQVSGGTTTFFGSFVVDSIALHVQPTIVTIDGIGKYTWAAAAPKIRVSIPRTFIFAPPAPATVQFFTTTNKPGALYICQYATSLFRSVQYEVDRVADVAMPVFSHYNTGSLPSGGPARDLSVVAAYAEAGIELQTTAGSDIIPINEENWDKTDHTLDLWDDAELHHSMELHFSMWRDLPQWAVWEVACWEHVMGPNLLGIMFDQQGKQRQGCAVFYKGLAGTTPDKLRQQLFCYVHELGHCFNLMHSWQKSYAQPPQANRPDSLSWMNYPQLYSGGEAAFWNKFAFQFDDAELIHLRHAFYNDIIPGGNDFTVGAALDQQTFNQNAINTTGLRLELSVEKPGSSFLFGEPVVVKVRLTGTEGSAVHPYLHPNCGLLQLGICRPNGEVLAYHPIIDHCVKGQAVILGPESPALEESIYCGFGKDGFYFDRTGFYQLRAIYNAPDGSRVTSNILRLRVKHPVNAADEEVADLFFGQDQGTLLYLQGSDSEFLRHGRDRLNMVLEKHPTHPLSAYVRLIDGTNAGRPFKTIDPKQRVVLLRPRRLEESVKLLSQTVEMAEKNTSLDSLTLERTVHTIAGHQIRMGDKEGAEASQRRAQTLAKKHTPVSAGVR